MSEVPDIPVVDMHDIVEARRALDHHGFGLQYAIVRRAEQLLDANRSPWTLQGCEFPIVLNGHTTHVDFILSHRERRTSPIYLVAECKRVNPAYSNWLFVRAPYTTRNPRKELYIERVATSEIGKGISSTQFLEHAEEVYHVGLEVKGREKGDPSGEAKGAINGAITQVFRGTNGLAQTLVAKGHLLPSHAMYLMPVIFTTARLLVSAVDLGEADLSAGARLPEATIRQVDWLWFQYHVSPALKHEYPHVTERNSEIFPLFDKKISDMLTQEYARNVAVVSARGLDSFLCWPHWTHLTF